MLEYACLQTASSLTTAAHCVYGIKDYNNIVEKGVMENLTIHPRVFVRHPQLSESDIRHAWENAYFEALRTGSPNFPEYLWIGADSQGREIEMVGVRNEDGCLIYHANTPISKRTLAEIKRARRRC